MIPLPCGKITDLTVPPALLPFSMLRSLLIACLVSLTVAFAQPEYQPKEGDVVFQSSPNGLGMDLVDMIEGATGSHYSHCGMVLWHGEQWCVIEAIGPVRVVPLAAWRDRGRKKSMWVYRIKPDHQKHIPAALRSMKADLGKGYDFRYRLDDEAIYCSELIYRGWKTATGEPMGKLVKLKDLNWKPYEKLIVRLEGSTTIPLEREIITPRDLAQAKQLEYHWPPQERHKKFTLGKK
jgi:hypothetical protein